MSNARPLSRPASVVSCHAPCPGFCPLSCAGEGPAPPTEEEQDAAARTLQRAARGKQGRAKVQKRREWKSSQDAWKEANGGEEGAAIKIQSITRGKQHRKQAMNKKSSAPGKGYTQKGSEEYEATLKAGKKGKKTAELNRTGSSIYRDDLGDGGDATMELERQRAALKIQSIARGKQQRKAVSKKKAEYDANPEMKPKGYKQYSEYHGDKSNPYMVKMNAGKKKKSNHGDVYLAKEKAAAKIQSIQRGKAARARVKAVKIDYANNPDSAPKGFGKVSDEEYEAKLKAGKKK